jgi:hypothetical protein
MIWAKTDSLQKKSWLKLVPTSPDLPCGFVENKNLIIHMNNVIFYVISISPRFPHYKNNRVTNSVLHSPTHFCCSIRFASRRVMSSYFNNTLLLSLVALSWMRSFDMPLQLTSDPVMYSFFNFNFLEASITFLWIYRLDLHTNRKLITLINNK